MANVQHPGFLPAQTTGSAFTNRRWPVASSASRIRKGDATKFSGASVALATSASTAVAGVGLHFVYTDSTGKRLDAVVLPASDTVSDTGVLPSDGNWCYMPDDEATIFVASIDEAVTTAELDLNFSMVLNTASAKYSDHELDATSPAGTATIPWRFIGFVERPGVDPDAADAEVYCRINAGMVTPSTSVSTGVA